MCNWASLQVYAGQQKAPLIEIHSGRSAFSKGTLASLLFVNYFYLGGRIFLRWSFVPFGFGDSTPPNRFVTQFRSMGRWFKYDCAQVGTTSSSDVIDPDWRRLSQQMLLYE